MSTSGPQFDKYLGGEQDLPQEFTIMNFASARAHEILALTEALQEPPKTGLVFQRLPRHMRRRVMSHNAKRMPRQLREAHMRQMEKSGLPPKSKRPSRKYRRRPSNLLMEYNRRQREFIWLETHIWHAKRFHMINKWGYKLANFPNDKSIRACYRGAANHCLIQDISYYACIEIEGEFDYLTRGLKMLNREECGLTFCAKAWQEGKREGSATIFHHDSTYPFGAIGRVQFLWKPVSNADEIELKESSSVTNQRTIWIWVHPSYYNEVKDELVQVFQLKPNLLTSDKSLEPPPKKLKSEKSKSITCSHKDTNLESVKIKEVPKILCSHIHHYEGNSIKMTLLKDKLVRFRLTGPLSQAVLRETLLLAPLNEVKYEKQNQWWNSWHDVFKCQYEIWEDMAGITSPAMVSPHMVMGLTILDPRCNLPEKRTKAIDLDYIFKSEILKGGFSVEASRSPIWNPHVRDSVTRSKPTDAQINKRQSKNLVPGISEGISNPESTSSEENDDILTRVPILLIQRPGSQDSYNKRLGYCAGWDIIAPAGWGKPLWLALVLRGARAGGLREAEMVEDIGFSQMLCWPPLPDTKAGKDEMKQKEMELKEKYLRLPPSKRPNYTKLGISSPFSCPWNILCREWSTSISEALSRNTPEDTFYVLRDHLKLKLINGILDKIKNNKSQVISLCKSEGTEISYEEDIHKLPDGKDHCLIPVRVTAYRKGVIANFALICIPITKDIKKIESKNLKSEIKGPMEPNNPDPYQEERKQLRKQHKQTLMRLRRNRVKQRKEADECTTDGNMLDSNSEEVPELNSIPRRPLMGPESTQAIRDQYKIKMEELFLPPVFEVRKSCSREVAGYVIHGIFSFSDAKEIGMAYITFPSLLNLLKTNAWNPELLVLVRNTHCQQYIFARIEVITN